MTESSPAQSAPAGPSRRTPRVRPSLRRAAIAAFAILLPIAAHSLWDYVETRRLVREIERLQQKGEPVSLRDALGGAAPLVRVGQDRDAASYYLAGGLLALGSNGNKTMTPVREWLASSHPDRQAIDRIASPLRDLVERSRNALQVADAAAERPFTSFPGGTEFSYRTSGLGALSDLVTARTLIASLAGRADDAVDSVISGLRIRRVFRVEPWRPLGNHHVDAVLSLTHPSPEALRRLQAALEDQESPNQALDTLLRERARFLEAFWHGYYGFDPAAPSARQWPARSLMDTVFRPWFTHRAIETLHVWAELIGIARSPSPPSADVRAALAARYGAGTNGPGTFALLVFTRATDATELIVDRCSRVAVAIERFRRDHHGALPGDLSQLAPHYLATVPVDPYSRGPLLFRSGTDAYTIYSAGSNQQDDGGDLGRPALRGADVGVRILVQH